MDFSTAWQTIILPWLINDGIRLFFIVAGLFAVQRIVQIGIDKAVERYTTHTYKIRDGVAKEKREETLESVFSSTARVVIWILGGMVILSELGINTGPLIAGAGIAGLAFGFGGQYLIRDIISGFFVILEDQYRDEDVVKIAGIVGVVENINLRRTILRDLDGIEHHIPNGEIKTAANYTKFWSRAHLNIGVAYKENVDRVIEVLNRIGAEMATDDQWKDDITTPIKVLGITEFSDSAVIIKVLGDTKPSRQWDVMYEYRRRVKNVFDEEGIEIPFPHRVIFQR